jgi:hypothetical protein
VAAESAVCAIAAGGCPSAVTPHKRTSPKATAELLTLPAFLFQVQWIDPYRIRCRAVF